MKWQDAAACRDKPTDMFYQGRGADFRPALAVCSTCPVKHPNIYPHRDTLGCQFCDVSMVGGTQWEEAS